MQPVFLSKPYSSAPSRGRLFPIALLAVAVSLGFSGLAKAADSLLPDGSFEKPNPSGEWPIGWGKAKNVTWESETGNYFLRLSSPTPGTHVSLYHKVLLPAGLSVLELSFRARVTGLLVGEQRWYDARIILNFRDSTGKVTTAKGFPYFSQDTAGWEVAVHQIVVPPDSVTLEILPSLFRVQSGTFDIDDLVLRPVEAAAK